MDNSALIETLKQKGYNEKIISAFQKVKRENFLPPHLIAYAYEDIALPLQDGSSISQPSTISFMLSLLDLHQNQSILEIGSGSGYALALMSEIIKDGKIYGLEISDTLAIKSASILKNDSNISVFNRSGSSGLTDFAPYDRILVSASFKDMRIPYEIAEQLKEGGILIAPVKSSIFKIKKVNGKLIEEEYYGFSFVPFKED